MKKIFISVLLMGSIAAFPIYKFESGSIQISHLLFLLTSTLLITNRGVLRIFSRPNHFIFLFILYATIRQCIFLFETNEFRYQIFIYFTVYSWLIYFGFSSVATENAYFLYLTVFKGLVLSVIVAGLGVAVYGYSISLNDDGSRAIGTFNNPNQLGYYSVLLLSFVLLFKAAKITLSKLYSAAYQVLPFFAIILSILSLSKAAIITVLLGVAYLSKKNMLIAFSVVLLVGILMLNIVPNEQIYNLQFVNRLLSIGSQSDDSLEGRGYMNLMELDLSKIFFGAGEGFHSIKYGFEIHSTMYNLLVSYGLIGSGLFLSFNLGLFRRALINKIDVAISMALPMTYGLTHNGIRSTLFWLLLAMIYLLPYVQTVDVSNQQRKHVVKFWNRRFSGSYYK